MFHINYKTAQLSVTFSPATVSSSSTGVCARPSSSATSLDRFLSSCQSNGLCYCICCIGKKETRSVMQFVWTTDVFVDINDVVTVKAFKNRIESADTLTFARKKGGKKKKSILSAARLLSLLLSLLFWLTHNFWLQQQTRLIIWAMWFVSICTTLSKLCEDINCRFCSLSNKINSLQRKVNSAKISIAGFVL